jgi:hypothetical protein
VIGFQPPNPEWRLPMNFTLKPKQERKIESYELEISFSEADKGVAAPDLASFFKQQLEKQGHKVRRVVLTTEIEIAARDGIAKGASTLRCPDTAHIVYPDSERSLWIIV